MHKLLIPVIVFLPMFLSAQFENIFTIPGGNSALSLAANTDFVFAGTSGSGLFRSPDKGITWQGINNGIPPWYYYSLLSAQDSLWAGSFGFVYFSDDNGDTWIDLNTGLGFSDQVLALARKGPDLLAGIKQKGIYVNIIGTTIWIPSNNGLHANPTINDILVLGNDLFAASDSGVYVSTNSAASWTLLDNGLPSVLQVLCLLYLDPLIFAGTNDGVYKSEDDGITWTLANTGITIGSDVVSLAASNDSIFAGTFDNLYVTSNAGIFWEPFNEGLPSPVSVYSLITSGEFLFAGTGGAIYRYQVLPTWIGNPERVDDLPVTLSYDQALRRISLKVPENYIGAFVTITDLAGRKLNQAAIAEVITYVETGSLGTGICLVHIYNEDHQITKKVIICPN